MKEFFKAFLSFGLATSIEKLLGFILLPIYTREFSVIEYGSIDLIQTIVAMASVLGVLQLETSLQRYYYEYQTIRKRLFISNIYLMILGLSLVISFLVFILSGYLAESIFKNTEYTQVLKIAAFQIPLTNVSMLGLVLLRYEKENFKFLIVIIVKVVASLLFVYLFVIVFDLKINGVFMAQISALLISTLLVTWYVRRTFIFKISKFFSNKSFVYALPQIPARIGSSLLAYGNRFFMISFLSISAIGLYSVSLKLASAIQLIYTAFVMAWSPFMFAQFKNKNNKIIFATILPIVSIVVFCFVTILSLLAPEIFNLVSSKEFIAGNKYLGVLSLYFGLYIVKEIVDIGPKYTEKTKFLSYNFFISVVINFVLLFLLTPLLKLEGVVLAMLFTNLTLVAVSWFTSNRLYYIPFNVSLFILLLLPVIGVCIISMYFDLELFFRILIGFCTLTFYFIIFIWKFKEVRKTLKNP